MEPINQFLEKIDNLGGKVWLDGEQLRYRGPKNALSPTMRTEMGQRKAEIIAFLQSQAGAPQIIPVRAADGAASLSYSQQRLWFIEQLLKDYRPYNESMVGLLPFAVDNGRLAQALTAISHRHTILRTTFPTHDGQPQQVVGEIRPFSLPTIDLTHVAEDSNSRSSAIAPAHLTHLQQAIDAEGRRPFDLAHGPLWRGTLFKLAPEKYALLLTLHHIIEDAWSANIIWQELAAFYEGLGAGKTADTIAQTLPHLPIQYSDFAAWQRSQLAAEERQKQLAYWQQQLANAPTILPLPTDQPRPAEQRFCGDTYTTTLPHSLSHQIKSLSRRHNATLFMTLLAAFKLLLARYSNQQDIVVGTMIANRAQPEVEHLVGLFADTLPLRTDLSDTATFADLLQTVRDNTLAALAHQNIPFEELVEALQPPRSLGYNPLFQVGFSMRHSFAAPQWVQPLALKGKQAKFDLWLEVQDTETGLDLAFEYNSDLFHGDTIDRMAGHLQTLLAGIVANPEQEIAKLPLLTTAETDQILVTWNDTQINYPTTCLPQLFAAQVARTPDKTAVVFGETELTYAELNVRANQLAHHLQTLGVGTETLVGLCVERSLDMIVGLLGILKAGSAYLPLDPTYPAERTAFILQDAAVSVVVTQATVQPSLPNSEATFVLLDSDWSTIAAQPQTNPDSSPNATDLAYTIYTSGTTGKPKGVQIPHQALTNFLLTMQQQPGITAADTLVAVTTLSFDIAALELYLPLITGAKLVIAPQEAVSDGLQLRQLLATATMMQATPTTWRLLLLSGWQNESGIKVLCGGEALPNELAKQLLTVTDSLWNLYGPTETTIWSTRHLVTEVSNRPVSIGQPIANTQVYVLDQRLQPVPIGVAGDFYIGGDGLARGYLNRPELTAEKFIASPFDNGRLYKTGDLARWLPDGTLEFLGRGDHQVKVRGFRIELGEIEAVLSQHPTVQQAVVVAQPAANGEARLVAYVVAEASAEDLTAVWHTHLQQSLPDYMLPSFFVQLTQFPLTPNGKIDRKALPTPQRDDLATQVDFAPPQGATEEMIAGVWAEVLGVEQIGRFDNFFNLGGHSLLATQVVSRLQTLFTTEITVRTLFERPVLHQLAVGVENGRQALSRPAIEPRRQNSSLRLSFAQQRLWFIDQYEGPSPAYNIPLAWRLTGHVNHTALEAAFNEIVARHEILRTTFPASDGQATQQIAPSLHIPLQLINLQDVAAAERENILRARLHEAAWQPFVLAYGPLLRTTLYQLSPTDYVLLLNQHHIISDGWSINVLMAELAQLYEAFAANLPSPLPNLDIQYADFALWQREWLQGEVIAHQLNYWQNQLATAPTLLNLPTDYPRPSQQSSRGAMLWFDIEEALVADLKQLSQAQGATLFMTFYATFAVLLSRYSGQDDMVIGSPMANRHYQEIEPLLGFFVNTLPLRVSLANGSQALTFTQLLGQVRQTTLAAQRHQDIPFEQLVTELDIPHNLSHAPLFQVVLSLARLAFKTEQLGDLQAHPLTLENQMAKFDLTLFLMEDETGLRAAWEYNTDLFAAATIERMATHFQNLLTTVIVNPDQPVANLPLLTAAERQQMLVDWNNTTIDFPADKCFHELFAEQAARTPEATAVFFTHNNQTTTLSYHQLNQRANQLAHHLQRLGVQPETLVGLALDRSPDMIVALLAVWKAGGAFVPLDPTYPQERIAFMLADTQVPLIITETRFVAQLPGHAAQLVCLDTLSLVDLPTTEPETAVSPTNLAYLIYTSGSTGQPKGVLIEHRGLTNTSQAQVDAFGLTQNDRHLLFFSLNFDGGIADVILALRVGAALYFAPQHEILPGAPLHAFLQEHEITTLILTPSALAQVPHHDLPHLHTVIVAGETCSPQLVSRWADNRTFLNLYGATEVSIFSTVARCVADEQPPSVGRPVTNNTVYILDDNLEPVPIGTTGEIYIGGVGVARGYHNRPELNETRFIANPFDNPNANLFDTGRLYKTGDLGRYRPNGEIEFAERIDNQVKIRGFRVELDEIEAVLSQHPMVRETAVIVDDNLNGQQRLVAYVVATRETAVNGQATSLPAVWRTFLQKRLPDYMIPSAFAVLEQFPLTPNGKIDRQALPDPDSTTLGLTYQFVPPQTETEQHLAKLWAEALNIEKVGLHDNFFELGGHSLLATRLVAQMSAAFHSQIELRHLFETPTIAAIANTIDTQQADAQLHQALQQTVPNGKTQSHKVVEGRL